MKENEKVQFESMPDFFLNEKQKETPTEEKEYSSLYEELHEKCNPDRFMQPFIKERFDLATEIYAELRKRCSSKYVSDEDLKDLRNRAESDLGIHISTSKLFRHLSEYCSPDIYTKMKPFPTERVKESSRLYAKILDAKDNIHALEEIEREAESFIEQRKKDISQQQQEEIYQQKIKDAKEKRLAKEKRKNQLWLLLVWVVFSLIPEGYFGESSVLDILLLIVIIASIALIVINIIKKNISGCVTSIIILILSILKGTIPGFNIFPLTIICLTSTVFSAINIFKRNKNKVVIWSVAMITSLFGMHPYILEDLLVSLVIIGTIFLVRIVANVFKKPSKR